MQPTGEVTNLVESVRTPESLDALKHIVTKYRTQLEEIEEEEPFAPLAYGKLRNILEAGRSYFFFKNILSASYFGAVVGILTMMDLGIQYLFGPVREVGIVVTEVLIVVFGALTLIVFAPMSRTSLAEYKNQFESSTGLPMTHESLASLEGAAKEINATVNAVLTPPATVAVQEPLTLIPGEFTEVSKTAFERRRKDGILDVFDVSSEGIRVWREQRAGLNPRYLLGPYLISWERLRDSIDHRSDIAIGGLVVDANYLQQLLEFESRL